MKRLLYGLLFLAMTQNVSLHGAQLSPNEALKMLENLLENDKLLEIKDLWPLINGLAPEQKQSFCLKALNVYLNAQRLDEMKDLMSLINGLATEQKQSFCLRALNAYLKAQKLHEIRYLSSLIYKLAPEKKESFCSEALNFYLDAQRLHEIKNLGVLIYELTQGPIQLLLMNGLVSEPMLSFCSRALNTYFDAQRLHEIKDLKSLIYGLAQEQKKTFCLKALNTYLDAQKLHVIKDLKPLIDELAPEKKESFCSKALNFYVAHKTLFKHNHLIKILLPRLPGSTFYTSTKVFIEEISTLNGELQRQLHMHYIKKAMQEKRDPAKILKFSRELIEPLSLDNIIAIIEHIHESTDICGESMGKIRPLCEAYLLQHYDDLDSMPMEHFTDLFMPFITKVTLQRKIINSMMTFKSLVPQQSLPIGSLTFKSDTPKKIKELYTQYNGKLLYVDNEPMTSRDGHV